MGEFIAVAKASEVPAGSGKVVSAKGKPVALFNVDGAFHAIDNTCKHATGPLGEGELNNCIVTCPLHGWQYNVCTGDSTRPAGFKQTKYNVKVEGDDVFVEV